MTKSSSISINAAYQAGLAHFNGMLPAYLKAVILTGFIAVISEVVGESLKHVPVIGLLYAVAAFGLSLLCTRAYYLFAMQCASGIEPQISGLWKLDRRFLEFLLTLLVLAIGALVILVPVMLAFFMGAMRLGSAMGFLGLILAAIFIPLLIWFFLRTHIAIFLAAAGIERSIERSWAATKGRVLDNFSLILRAYNPIIILTFFAVIFYFFVLRQALWLGIILIIPLALAMAYYWARAQVIQAAWSLMLTGTAMPSASRSGIVRSVPKVKAKTKTSLKTKPKAKAKAAPKKKAKR